MVAMNNLWCHKGSKQVTYDDLEALPTPAATETYTPLSHHQFIYNTYGLGSELLESKGFTLASEKFLISNDGGKMFFMLGYQNGTNGMQMVAAGRNSTDKSMAVCLSVGGAGRVIVCDNLMVTGEIVIFRRHTKNLFEDLETKLVMSFRKAADQWRDLQADVTMLKEVEATPKDAHDFYVTAARANVISRPTLFKALDEYHEPRHPEQRDGSMWEVYNAGTQALKSGPIGTTLHRHKQFHDFAREYVGHAKQEIVLSMGEGEDNIQRDEEFATG